jgi:DNA repair protein RadC
MKSTAARKLFSVTEVELIYRNKTKKEDRPKVIEASHAYDILLSGWDMNRINLVEEFAVLLLDRNNACMAMSKISRGGITACVVDPKIVFATALKARACGIIMAHNHPSGNLKPSSADLSLTHKFKEAGTVLDIAILDHLIITPNAFLSFADEGLIPTYF